MKNLRKKWPGQLLPFGRGQGWKCSVVLTFVIKLVLPESILLIFTKNLSFVLIYNNIILKKNVQVLQFCLNTPSAEKLEEELPLHSIVGYRIPTTLTQGIFPLNPSLLVAFDV